jgi:hypothetical protein
LRTSATSQRYATYATYYIFLLLPRLLLSIGEIKLSFGDRIHVEDASGSFE